MCKRWIPVVRRRTIRFCGEWLQNKLQRLNGRWRCHSAGHCVDSSAFRTTHNQGPCFLLNSIYSKEETLFLDFFFFSRSFFLPVVYIIFFRERGFVRTLPLILSRSFVCINVYMHTTLSIYTYIFSHTFLLSSSCPSSSGRVWRATLSVCMVSSAPLLTASLFLRLLCTG